MVWMTWNIAISNRVRAIFIGLSCVVSALFLAAASIAAPIDNARVRTAMESFEVLTETALVGDVKKIAKALNDAESSRTKVRALLSESDAARLEGLFSRIEAANAKHDYVDLSLQAAELYKLMVLSLDAATLKAPTREVNLLDYAGFRLTALLRAPSPDWVAIAATTNDAQRNADTIRDKLNDPRLQRNMNDALKAVTRATAKRDVALARDSVKKILNLVDEIENHLSLK